MFSIIIPLYNKAAYIERAIQSVLSQTYQKFELIVVNDGSSDNSLEIAQKFLISNTKCKLIDQENQGVSVARNNGVKVAVYDYIAFLDADDWWEQTYLEEMSRLTEEFPGAGMFGSGYYIVKNRNKQIAPVGINTGFDKGVVNYFSTYSTTLCMPFWTGATIIQKSIFELEHGFKPELKLGEDFDLWVRIALKYPVVLLNKPLSNYNQDVELTNRAIGQKLYEPREHMLFTDYGELNNNIEFRLLYERLALYGLIPYYLSSKNSSEVTQILNSTDWRNHAFKYRLYYILFPKLVLKAWMFFLSLGSKIKQILIKFLQPFFNKSV